MRVLEKESTKLASSSFELYRRRLNWRLVTQQKIEEKFKEIAENARSVKYPFNLFCQVHDETTNETTVQLSSGANKTGVVEKIDTPEKKGVSCEGEKGSALVASFSSSGSVAFIIYPYKSDRYARKEENIILYIGLSPDDVSHKIIEKCISKYLFYNRNSSIYGVYSNSLMDTLKINWMTFIDVRNRKKLYRGFWRLFIEWSKIVGAGIAGYIVAVITQTP
ncbi:hypothetical protein L8R84_22440 [Vibrio splendidus]|uniref:hypothetical protein n=1 Tax=Vibrio splendidus TaxID=29497 RepID=UPI00246958FB|nr:hypothetical protein [Vibrio splendidus]MDH5902260.1 hypothetical protein [Vibrio splendidus]MDH5938868.1 hypothetical protein [Vibrio splendidus]